MQTSEMQTNVEIALSREEMIRTLGIPESQVPESADEVVLALTGTARPGASFSEGMADLPAPLRDLLRYEERMLQWLAESEANARKFALDPLATLQQVCDVPRELIETLESLDERGDEAVALEEATALEEEPWLGMDEDTADASGAPTSAPPDLSAGWDLVNAEKQGAVNHRLKALCDSGAFPSELQKTFTVKRNGVKLKCTAQMDPGCPQFGAPVDGNPTLNLPIDGTIKVSKLGIPFATVTISGQAALSMDLDLLGVTATTNGEGSLLVAVQEPDGDLFTDLDLSQLEITVSPGPSLDPETYSAVILAAMNGFVDSVSWPLTWTIETRVPLPPQGLQGHLAYSVESSSADENLFAVLISRETRTGSFNLAAQTVPDGSSAAFVVANQAILSGEAVAIAKGLGVPVSDFQVTDDYPAEMQLTTNLEGKSSGVKYKIDSGDLVSYFNSQGQLYIGAKAKVKGWATLWIWQTVKAEAWITFYAEDGQLKTKTKYKAHMPWWSIFVPGSFLILIFLLFKGSGGGNSAIPIPGFYVETVSSPAYLQAGGRWDEQIFHFDRNPGETTLQVATVSQALNANSGKFEFDFSAYGKSVVDYVVGVAYWSFKYSNTDHQTQEIGLSLSNTKARGAKVTVKPVATLSGEGKTIDESASTLTLCCVAVLNQDNPEVTLEDYPDSIDNGDVSDAIGVEDSGATGLLAAIMNGWDLEYGNSHHVRTIRLSASLTDETDTSIEILSQATMHDDSNHDATGSIDGGVVKLAASQDQVIVGQVTPSLQDPDSDYVMSFDSGVSLSAAAVFLQTYGVHYHNHDHDVLKIGGGTSSWTVDGSTVTLSNPHAFIADNSNHSQENSESFVSLVVIGLVDGAGD